MATDALAVVDEHIPVGVEMQRPGVNASGSLILPTPQQLETLKQFGEMYVQSGLLPGGIKSWQAVAVTIQHGMDLGIPISTAIQQIYVISGKPVCSAALMASLIYRDHGDDALQLVESTEASATYAYKRRSWPELRHYTFTIEDAKRANLVGKDTWKQYPKSMLRARCIADIAHGNFQDTIGGLYLRDEIEPTPTTVAPLDQQDGEFIDAEASVVDVGQTRAGAGLLTEIAKLGEQLGLTKEQLQFKAGKPGKELTVNEAESLRGELEAELERVQAGQGEADPTTGELPGIPPASPPDRFTK